MSAVEPNQELVDECKADLNRLNVAPDAGAPTARTALRSIRDEILASTARVKIVILDCCHSGKAFGTGTLAGADVGQALEDIAAIDGSYVGISPQDPR